MLGLPYCGELRFALIFFQRPTPGAGEKKMPLKRRPMWIWIGAVYALFVFASAAGIAFGLSLIHI